MPKLSSRAEQMPASPIRRLVPYAEKAAEKGIKIHHLNIGQPDVESAPLFWQAIQHADMKVLAYSHSAGDAVLRARMREIYGQTFGIKLEENELIVTTAGSEALRFALMACLDQGEEVIIPEPLYANYLGFAVESGIQVVPVTTRIEDGFALPDPSEFEKKITPKTRAILICNPNNPTGAIYSGAQMQALRDIVLRHNLFLIADEVYREFNYTSESILSVLQLEGLDDHAIMVDSVSKRFSLCGARVGFMVSKNAGVMAAALKFAQARLSPPTLEMAGVLGALNTPESYFERVREEYRARRDLMCAALNKMQGVLCPTPEGAFYSTVRLPIDDSDRFCRWLLEEFSHEGQTVMMAPATGFYETPGLGQDEVRIAYVLNQEKLAQAMGCLEHALAVYPGSKTREQRSPTISQPTSR